MTRRMADGLKSDVSVNVRMNDGEKFDLVLVAAKLKLPVSEVVRRSVAATVRLVENVTYDAQLIDLAQAVIHDRPLPVSACTPELVESVLGPLGADARETLGMSAAPIPGSPPRPSIESTNRP